MTAVKPTNMMSIDVEDYFHVSAFEKISPPSSWAKRESRVDRNIDLVLAILDESSQKATFFILGWVAERLPHITKKIAQQGHEIASHGYMHQRVTLQDRATYRQDITRSKALLEDQSGTKVLGYRAPSYSITRQTDWAFDELLEAGYQYDSSIFPIHHDYYGIQDWPRFSGYAFKGDAGWESRETPAGRGQVIREIPISTLRLGKKNLPIAGGGYFRLFPYALTLWGLSQINKKEDQPFVFYLHPWELDPMQPRMQGAGLKSHFRHYVNLSSTEEKFRKLTKDFVFEPLRNCQ